MRKRDLVELHNKSSHKTGEMPKAALMGQLDRASLLFLMCSAYTAINHHTFPGSLHTLLLFFHPPGFPYIMQCLTLPHNTRIVFKWALTFLYCFYWLGHSKSIEWESCHILYGRYFVFWGLSIDGVTMYCCILLLYKGGMAELYITKFIFFWYWYHMQKNQNN